jgi:murein DD-endopeptidase MepM/ murein hydrolase activator NlpD
VQGLPKSTTLAADPARLTPGGIWRTTPPWLRLVTASALGLAACASLPGDNLRAPASPASAASALLAAEPEAPVADMGPAVDQLAGTLAAIEAPADSSAPVLDRLAIAWDRLEHAASWEIYQRRVGSFATVVDWAGAGARNLAALVSRSPAALDAVDMAHIDFTVLVADPVTGAESSGYGPRRDPINRRRKFHKGIDYRADRGTPVYAAGPGVVIQAGRHHGYGKLIVVDHGQGLTTRYAHLSKIEVAEGDFVPAGQEIGAVGATGRATGPHLHFEVRQNGEALNPYLALQLAAEANGAAPTRIADVTPLAAGLGPATIAGISHAVAAFTR